MDLPASLVEYMKVMHNLDIIWKPKNPDDIPPF